MSTLPTCPIICITGPDGTGKSTLIGTLCEAVPGSVAVSIWDMMRAPDFVPVLPFQSPGQVDTFLEVLDPVSRALFLFHCYYQALVLAEKEDPKLVFTDGYWYKYFATELNYGAREELLRPLVSIFPQPALSLFLELDFEVAAQRKARFSGYESGFPEEKGPLPFRQFQRGVLAHMSQLPELEAAVRLDANLSPEMLAETALAQIRDFVPVE